jgi:hypothetical protein
MTAIAVAELTVDAPRALAFSKFLDYSQWSLWMPPDFRPVAGPPRALRLGDKIKIGLGPKGRVPLQIEVIRIRQDREICWRGGPAALLQGEHSFLFADADAAAGTESKTRIRSEEPLRGLLTMGPLAARVERVLSDGASVMLARFASYLTTGRAVP